MHRKRFGLKTKIGVCLGAPVVMIVLIELALRVLGFPQGRYGLMLRAAAGGEYPPNTVAVMGWGPLPYIVSTNSMGLRGPDVPIKKSPGALRIFAAGDSITDGFFVEYEASWPPQLQALLGQVAGQPVEVINGATGGGAIREELNAFRRVGKALLPDIVLLTFCTNDIGEELRVPIDQLTSLDDRLTSSPSGAAWIFSNTATGECAFAGYLRLISSKQAARATGAAAGISPERYNIRGGSEFAKNSALYLERFGPWDGRLLRQILDDGINERLVKYEQALAVLNRECEDAGARLVFVYYPAYPQIYDATPTVTINARLRDICARIGVTFIDLTEGFRARGKGTVLHLAPLDFHLNPTGNRVMAELLAEELAKVNSTAPTPRPLP